MKERSQQQKQIEKLQKEINKISNEAQRNKPKPPPVEKKPLNLMDTPMTSKEKSALKDSIPELTFSQQSGILQIVQDSCNNKSQGEVYEFELDMLSVRKCRELEKYVSECIKENIKKKKRKDADKKRRENQRNIKREQPMPSP